MQNEIKYRDTILYDKRRRSAGTMSVKRNAKRRQSDSQYKVDALVGRYSDRIERKDIRRANRKAGRRVATR